MNKYPYAHKRISEIGDPYLGALIEEIGELRGQPRMGDIIQFIGHCLHPDGQWRPFKPEELRTIGLILQSSYLKMKIGKLAGTEIYLVCKDLTAIARQGSIENRHGETLYVFLNKTLRDPKKKR